MVTQIGHPTASAQKHVVVECRREIEHVPIHRPPMAERTAVDWDPTTLPGNAAIRRVQVQIVPTKFLNVGVYRSCLTHTEKKAGTKIFLKFTHRKTKDAENLQPSERSDRNLP